MCGILGFVSTKPLAPQLWRNAQLRQGHRGPNGQGEWTGTVGRWTVGLAHQRLAIIDLSETGAQPATHPDTGSILVFNGEIYNYVEMRARLARTGVTFRGASDTEVLHQAMVHDGIDAATREANGMWAFAWLDRRGRRLVLSRDRCGEKPLYWVRHEDGIYFASELKTLLALTGRRYALRSQVIGEYLEQSQLDATQETFYAGIFHAAAGENLIISLEDVGDLAVDRQSYWNPRIDPESNRVPLDEAFIERLRANLLESVRIRLRSDVPVGLLLSGGLDSSAILGAARTIQGNDTNLALLSAVSEDLRFDESRFVDQMAQHWRMPVAKVSLPLQPGTLFEHIAKATDHMDTPLGSLSNVAHYLLMQEAKNRGITVILSGQGADELLCGYKKYLGFWATQLAREGRWLAAFRVIAAFGLNRSILPQFNLAEAKRYLPQWMRRKDHVLGPALAEFVPIDIGFPRGMTVQHRQWLDLTRFSVPALTHYEDRMSMAWSREIRLPFLDTNVIEQLIPASMSTKLAGGWTKIALRRAAEPWLPPSITWRKDKQGFVNPQSEWLKTSLRRQVLDDYFSPGAEIFKRGLVDRDKLLQNYDEYTHQPAFGGRIWFREVFNPLALEIWLRTNAASIA